MEFITGKNSWPPDRTAAAAKRKHEEVQSPLDEEGRKKVKAEDGVNGDDSNRPDSEESHHSPSSIDPQQSPIPQNSLPSPPIHPDRLQRFTRGTDSHNTTSKEYLPSPLSRSPEQTSNESAAEELKSSTFHHPNQVWKAESRRLSSGSSHAKSLQIDTARAISDLDPRSPGYTVRGMPSQGSRDKTSSHQQRSRDADPPSSNPPSRRQSDAMLPPSSAGPRPPYAESSATTKATFPVTPMEIMNPTSAGFIPPGRRVSMPKDSNLASDANGIAMPKATGPRIEAPVALNFTGFAQSIMSTTSVNIKLEHIKGLAFENVKESRRQEKHNVAYASLIDLTNANYGAIQKAEMRLEKQFERCNANQDLIANTLKVHPVQPPTVPSKIAAINLGTELPKELADMREDLRELRSKLADHIDKSIRQKDLEGFSQKFASLDDLKQLITREELLDIMSKPPARNPDLESLEAKVSDLADLTTERHGKAQETQQQFDKQLRDLDSETRITGQRRYTNTQTDLAKVGDDLGALKECSGMQTKLAELLEKSVVALKEDAALFKEDLSQFRNSQSRLETFVRGDSIDSEVGLSKLIEKASKEISQSKILVEQLQEKVSKLEEGTTKDSVSMSPHQHSTPMNDTADPSGHIDSIREHLIEVTGATDELKQEFYAIADDVDIIRQGLKSLRDEYERSKVVVEKQPAQLLQPARLHAEVTAPAHPTSAASLEMLDHVKLEKLENDLQALNVFTKSQQLRFDNLTTEDMARSIIHQTKQLYKEHPGHVQDKLRTLEEQQRNVDVYITSNLQPRLALIDTRITGRAAVDALLVLNSRVQVLEANMKEAISQIVQTRKDHSEGIAHVRRPSVPHDQGPDSARIHEILITLREELKEVRSKHAELVEVVMTRHGKLRGDVQILNREIYTEAAGNPRKQAELRGSMEYIDLIKLNPDDPEETRDSESWEQNKGITFRAPVASVSSRGEGSVASTRNRLASASADNSDAPHTQLQERKRKRQSLPYLTVDEEVDDHDARRRPAGKGLQ